MCSKVTRCLNDVLGPLSLRRTLTAQMSTRSLKASTNTTSSLPGRNATPKAKDSIHLLMELFLERERWAPSWPCITAGVSNKPIRGTRATCIHTAGAAIRRPKTPRVAMLYALKRRNCLASSLSKMPAFRRRFRKSRTSPKSQARRLSWIRHLTFDVEQNHRVMIHMRNRLLHDVALSNAIICRSCWFLVTSRFELSYMFSL